MYYCVCMTKITLLNLTLFMSEMNTLCQNTATGICSLTLVFLLLNWKIPRRPFFSALPKLVVLERMESSKEKEEEEEEQEKERRGGRHEIHEEFNRSE